MAKRVAAAATDCARVPAFHPSEKSVQRAAFVTLLALLSIQGELVCASTHHRPLTVADSIEATRILYGFDYENAIRRSPDGKRYVVILYRGDLERNGNWVEFFSGTTDSLDTAGSGQYVARLFTKDHEVLHLLGTPIIWLNDNERIAFIWNDGEHPGQVTTLNLRTHQVETLTDDPQGVQYFDINPDGATLAYTSFVSAPDYRPRFGQETLPRFAEMLRNGFAVSDSTFTVASLLRGYPDDRSLGFYTQEIFVKQASRQQAPRKVGIDGYSLSPLWPKLSPDGRWAILAAPPVTLSDQWDRYTADSLKRSLAIARRTPDQPDTLTQLWLIDTESAKARPLWDVPYPAPPPMIWAADNRSVLVTPTFLPLEQVDAAGLAGTATAVVDIATGRFTQIDSRSSGTVPRRFRNVDGRWEPVPRKTSARGRQHSASVRIEVREDPNTPPALFAVDAASGQKGMILDLNPELRTEFSLGRVELIHWSDHEGRAWSGRLYYPVSYAADRRFPFVILTAPRSATSPQQFSLRGSELTACVLSIAQPLANRNMAALVMAHPDDPKRIDMATPDEGKVVLAGYESAIEHLIASGLVARDRVGLIGYSRTGYYVQYALTHSRFPFAAAVSADNADFSYLQYVLELSTWGRAEYERVNGAVPVGEGLQAWLERAPGFNADKVRTPLRMEINNGGVTGLLGQWEFFSQLRYLGKPVELYVIPDIDHGSHGLLLPNQQLASLGGALEWMDFWLNGNEDPDPTKADQFNRWRKLREQRGASAHLQGSEN